MVNFIAPMCYDLDDESSDVDDDNKSSDYSDDIKSFDAPQSPSSSQPADAGRAQS